MCTQMHHACKKTHTLTTITHIHTYSHSLALSMPQTIPIILFLYTCTIHHLTICNNNKIKERLTISWPAYLVWSRVPTVNSSAPRQWLGEQIVPSHTSSVALTWTFWIWLASLGSHTIVSLATWHLSWPVIRDSRGVAVCIKELTHYYYSDPNCIIK